MRALHLCLLLLLRLGNALPTSGAPDDRDRHDAGVLQPMGTPAPGSAVDAASGEPEAAVHGGEGCGGEGCASPFEHLMQKVHQMAEIVMSLAGANHEQKEAANAVLNGSHCNKQQVETLIAYMELMQTDQEENEGLTLTEGEIDHLTGHPVPHNGKDMIPETTPENEAVLRGFNQKLRYLGGHQLREERTRAIRGERVHADAAMQFSDLKCGPEKFDPTKGYHGIVDVPYCIDPNMDEGRQKAARAAMQKIMDDGLHDCIGFVEQSCDEYNLQVKWTFVEEGTCYTNCMPKDDSDIRDTIINMGWCDSEAYLGSLIKEMGHALGLGHEQKRPDRDDYVTVHPDKIEPGWESQYKKDPAYDSHRPYNYNSLVRAVPEPTTTCHFDQSNFAPCPPWHIRLSCAFPCLASFSLNRAPTDRRFDPLTPLSADALPWEWRHHAAKRDPQDRTGQRRI